MLRLLIIIAVLTAGCVNVYNGNEYTNKVVGGNIMPVDTVNKKASVIDKQAAEEDTVYNSSVISYKDSIDRKIKMLRKTIENVEGLSVEGGEAVVYTSGPDTLKMNVTLYGEMGKSLLVIYLRNNYPVVYNERTTFYEEPFDASKDLKRDSVLDNKIILRNHVVVSWMRNGEKVVDKFDEKGRDIKDVYERIQDLGKD